VCPAKAEILKWRLEEIALYGNYDIEEKKQIVKKLAGIST
jgi:hypothetical protein